MQTSRGRATQVAALREMNGKKAMKKAQRGLGGNRIDGADLLVPAEGAETTGPVRCAAALRFRGLGPCLTARPRSPCVVARRDAAGVGRFAR